MVWTLRLVGESLQFHQDKQSPQRRSLTSEDTTRFTNWAERYGRAVKARNHSELLAIGQEVFGWLEDDGHRWGSQLTDNTGQICLDIVTDKNPDDGARDFLDVPWELLARDGVYLAEDDFRPFCLQRRLGEAGELAAPQYKDLAVMFMAAAPRNVEPVLDFEGEEAGILAATDNLPLALTVEESGSADFLKDRLADDGPFEVMHLTCHGNIGKEGPVLALEDEGGYLALTSAGTLAATLGSEKPGLLFLSACRTAENDGPTAPLAIQLMRAGVPAVLGWDGSVRDIDASAFARETYAELARHERPVFAVASARQRLLAQHRADQQKGQHWHLARLYVGANGGGALCARNAKMRPVFRGRAYSAFLDTERKKVPVAGPAAFVGRRR
ncbi:MAG: CHAT domain-containing protein, partial [Alphaproteobacteria bacterium]